MALTVLHPVSEIVVHGYTNGIGSTPSAAFMRSPVRGKILKVGVVQSAAVGGTSTVTFGIGATAITGGAVAVTAGAAGTHFSATPTAANQVVEDDVIIATPAGATGAGVFAYMYAVIRRN